MNLTVESLQSRVQEHSPVWFSLQSLTATGIAVLLEARTHPTAPLRIWDSVVQLTTCPPWAKSQKEPSRIWAVVSTLHAASLRRLNNLVWRIPTPRWVTCLPSGQRNRMARPNRWPASARALYSVMCFMCYFWECFKEEGGGGHPELGFRRPVFYPGSHCWPSRASVSSSVQWVHLHSVMSEAHCQLADPLDISDSIVIS